MAPDENLRLAWDFVWGDLVRGDFAKIFSDTYCVDFVAVDRHQKIVGGVHGAAPNFDDACNVVWARDWRMANLGSMDGIRPSRRWKPSEYETCCRLFINPCRASVRIRA